MRPSATTSASKKHSLISRSSSSKLKKRRGIPKDLGPEAFEYSLPASATTAAKSAVACKKVTENERLVDMKNNGSEGDFIQRHQRLDRRQSAQEDDIRERSVRAGENVVTTRNNSSLAHHSNTTAAANEKNHYLASIDSMDPPSEISDFSNALSSCSSSILLNSGINSILGKYKSSFSKFQMDLEKAFSLQSPRREIATSQSKGISILHPFLGRVGANLCPDDSISKLSFPHFMIKRDTNLDHSTITTRGGNGRNNFFIQQVIDLNRRRNNVDEKSVPLSVFRFPPNTLQHTTKEEPEIVSASNTLAKTATAASLPTTVSKDIVIGKIRIISDRGATVREAYDIDESKCILGTIHPGDERYFVDKRILPPPPTPSPTAKATRIDGNDGSSSNEEDDEECIAVTRYKILLHHGEHSLEPDNFVSLAERDENGNCFGWISDRGRLADDPYLILNEI